MGNVYGALPPSRPAWCLRHGCPLGAAPRAPRQKGKRFAPLRSAPLCTPPSRTAVPCHRLAVSPTHRRAEPSASAGGRFALGVVCEHRLCHLPPHIGFRKVERRHAVTDRAQPAGESHRARPRLKPVDETREQISGGTALASGLGSRGEAPGAGGVGGRTRAPRRRWRGGSPHSRHGQPAYLPGWAPALLTLLMPEWHSGSA